MFMRFECSLKFNARAGLRISQGNLLEIFDESFCLCLNVFMNGLPMKKTKQYTYPTNIKLSPEIGEGLEKLDKIFGVDVGELKRSAITEAVKEALKKAEKSAS